MQLYIKRESIEFRAEGAGIIATVSRGPSKARFAINTAIMKFVEQFSTPSSTDDAIERYCKNEAIELNESTRVRLQKFARQITATLLLTPIERNQESVEQSIKALGFRHLKTFKDKRFDTVSLVADSSRQFVVKNIKERLVSESVRNRIVSDLQNEFRALCRLKYIDGVVKPLEFRDRAPAYLSMGLVDGQRLDKFIKTSSISLQDRMSMAVQLARLVSSMHEAGVLHGDIHLGNFMCSADRTITVIDFGCAVLEGEQYRPSSGATPHFAPPERASESWTHVCEKGATAAGECYQIAIVIAYVLTGTLPFRGKTYRELHAAIIAGDFHLPDTTPEKELIPEQALALIVQMMHKDPAQRPIDLQAVSNQFLKLNKKETSHAI